MEETMEKEKEQSVWRGALPRDAVAELYSAARVVLGSTTAEQARRGMVNNRVFEALACGASLVMFRVDAVAELFGENIVVSCDTSQEMVHRVVTLLEESEDSIKRVAAAQRGRALVVDQHTYRIRARTIAEFASRVAAMKEQQQNQREVQDEDGVHGRTAAPTRTRTTAPVPNNEL
jgi:spore maturation protein CgeB